MTSLPHQPASRHPRAQRGHRLLLRCLMLLSAAFPLTATETSRAGANAGVGSPAGAPPSLVWPATASTPGYAAATAGDPHFGDKALWPGQSGKEFYLKEQWPKARLLVWANPGRRGVPKNAKKDDLLVGEPANWLEDGKPATKLWDKDTDLLLPAAKQDYEISMRDCGTRQEFRHITVEANVNFTGGGDGVGRQIHGNVWIKRGGSMGAQGATGFLGGKHVFVRNDNDEAKSTPWRDYGMLSQYFSFDKTGGASVEFLGVAKTGDEFGVHGCLVIVGPDSIVRPGREASPIIERGGTIALMDGAWFGNWTNNMPSPDMEVTGAIQGGLPERPLSRSCIFGLAFKNHTKAVYTNPKGQKKEFPCLPCLMLHDGSALRSYSTNVAKAHLILGNLGDIGYWDFRPPKGSGYEKEQINRKGDDAAERFAFYDGLPRGSDVYLGKGVLVDGVEFDWLRKGGLLLADPGEAQAWKNVFYGTNCAAKGAELFTRVDKAGNNGRY